MQLIADLNASPFDKALAEMGRGGQAFTQGFERQFKAMEKSIESDMDRLLRKVTADFNLAQERMQRGAKKTAYEIERSSQMAGPAAATAAMMGGGAGGGKGGKGSYRAGQVALQAQDIAVQMESGTNFGRILIQQGTQLASIFGPTGAIIAGLGAGAVLLYQWVSGAKQAEAEMKRYDEAVKDSIKSTEKLNQLTADRNREMVKSIYTRTRGQEGADKEVDRLKFEEEITALRKDQLAIEEKLSATRKEGEQAFKELQKTGFGEITSPDEAQGKLDRSVEMQRKLTDELLASKAAIKAVTDAYQEQEKTRKANAEAAAMKASERSKELQAEAKEIRQSAQPMTKDRLIELDREYRRISKEQKAMIGGDPTAYSAKEVEKAKALVALQRGADEMAQKRKKEMSVEVNKQIEKEQKIEEKMKDQAAQARKIGSLVKDAAEDAAKAFQDQAKALKDAETAATNLAARSTYQKVQDILDPQSKRDRERDKKRFDKAAREIGERAADEADRKNRKKGGRGISREDRNKIIADEIEKANIGKAGGIKIDKADMKEFAQTVAAEVNKLIPI